MMRIQNPKEVVLRVKDFPCLKRYAVRIFEKGRREFIPLKFPVEVVISYSEILKVDHFWIDILGSIGFFYSVSKDAFIFRKTSLPPVAQNHPVNKALRFVKELKRRNYL